MGLKEKIMAEVPEEFKGVHEYMDLSELAEHEGHHHIAKILRDAAYEEYTHGGMMMCILKDLHEPMPENYHELKMKAHHRLYGGAE